MNNLRRDRIRQFLEHPHLPAKFEFIYDDPHSDHRLWFSLIVSAPNPDRGYKVLWEYIAEVGSRKNSQVRFLPDKWDPEFAVAVFDMMNEDLADTPFKTPTIVLERPKGAMSWIGDIAALELIKS